MAPGSHKSQKPSVRKAKGDKGGGGEEVYYHYTSKVAKFKLFEYDVDLLTCVSDNTPFDPHPHSTLCLKNRRLLTLV